MGENLSAHNAQVKGDNSMRAGWQGSCLWLAALLMLSGWCHAQSVTPDQEYQKLIQVDQNIEPLGEHPFGENINLYDGTLSFNVTDVSLRGNGPAITVGRTLSFWGYLANGTNGSAQRPFGDWDLDIPRIETIVAGPGLPSTATWQTGGFPDATTGTTQRCTNFKPPPGIAPVGTSSTGFAADQYWSGYKLFVPGQGSQLLMPRGTANSLSPTISGMSFPIVSKNNWMIACGVSASDGGDGFLAIAPDGTRYTFARLVYRPANELTQSGSFLFRRDAFMYVTQIQDRFGNTLTYNYDPNSGYLTSITANDGREVDVAYQSGTPLIQTVTAKATNVTSRTWTYNYDTSTATAPFLTGVQLPDGSAWSYQGGGFESAQVTLSPNNCGGKTVPTASSAVNPTATMTAPSGLTATFTLTPRLSGRSYVPHNCYGGSQSSAPYSMYPEFSGQFSITSEVLSGAGIPTQTWSYSYSSPNLSWNDDACAASGTCVATVYTDVTDPNNNDTRYTFSNRFDATEGLLLRTDSYSGAAGATLIRSEANTYAVPTSGQWPWPTAYGTDLLDRDNAAQVTELSPLSQRTITQDGQNYTWLATSFDAYAQPTDVKRYNDIAGQSSIEETTAYLNDTNLWVLGLPLSVTNVGTGEVEISNSYVPDASPGQGLLQSRSRFGEFMMSYTYNGAGQLVSFTDGNNHTTNLSNYYRGIPQSISYPDNTSESFVVDDFGQISFLTDQAGNTTGYGYDGIGRVNHIVYEYNSHTDSAQWNSKLFVYNFVTTAERGISAGHWDRVETTGNAVTTTYFDVKLRPILIDASNGNQDITTAKSYDWTGATTFASYPVYGQPDVTAVTAGIHHAYDALGRETQTQEDSELGLLTTGISYLSGAGEQVTDPKGNVTTTYYQVFDEPSYKDPILVNAPAGIVQTITRDLYGNPTTITQSGAYGSENDSITKTLLYDNYHRLCRTTEPESGSTVLAYDAANNLSWSAQGQTITDGTCGQSGVATSAQSARTYDAMNRVLTITPPAGTQSTTYTYDSRGNVSTVASGLTTESFAYNTLNLLTTQTLSVSGSGYTWGIAYNYDAYGHINAMGYPAFSGTSEGVSYNPDAFGRATQVGNYASGITYFPNGQVSGFSYGNGAGYVAQQNARQLLNNFSYGAGGSLSIGEDLTYDANGNITNVNDLVNGQRTKTFGYDTLNRLTSATASNLYGTESYTYDALNNLRSRLTGGNTLTFNYDASNRLVGVAVGGSATTQYGYDAQGNRNSLTSGSTTTSYNFDAENQLLQVPGLESYAYNAAGRRVAKVPANGGASSYYFYGQGGQLMYEFDPAAGKGTNYIYLGTKLIAKNVITELALPGAITASSNPNNGTFTLSWGASPGATSYTLQESADEGAWNTIYSGSAASVSVSGRAGGNYVYQVQACASTGCGGWTTSPTIGVWPSIPSAVTVPTTTVNGTYTVSWTASAAASALYTVQESFNGGAWTTVGTVASTSITRPGTTTGSYTYRVEAFNTWGTEGWSATSAAVNVNTAYGVVPTPAPTFSVPSTNNTGAQTISWVASSPVTAYTLQQSTNGGNNWTTVYSGTSTSTTLTGLQSGSYTYQLQACNSAGGGMACTPWQSAGPMVVTIPPSSAPSLTVPSGVVNFTTPYTVSWTGVSAATSYSLQQQVNGGGWNTVQATSATNWSVGNEADGTYAYRVEGCNAGGCGPWSNVGTVTVDYAPSPAPTLSGGGTSSTGSYSLSWTAVANATSYTLFQSTNGGSTWTTVQSNGATSWSTSGQGSGTYIYMVNACDAGGCSGWSNQVTETVALAPATPAITVKETRPGTNVIASFTWTAESNATSYTLQEMIGTTVSTLYSGPNTSYSTGFPPSQTGTHSARVEACNSSGCSPWSGWVQF